MRTRSPIYKTECSPQPASLGADLDAEVEVRLMPGLQSVKQNLHFLQLFAGTYALLDEYFHTSWLTKSKTAPDAGAVLGHSWPRWP
jgi:hypothetical protein